MEKKWDKETERRQDKIRERGRKEGKRGCEIKTAKWGSGSEEGNK